MSTSKLSNNASGTYFTIVSTCVLWFSIGLLMRPVWQAGRLTHLSSCCCSAGSLIACVSISSYVLESQRSRNTLCVCVRGWGPCRVMMAPGPGSLFFECNVDIKMPRLLVLLYVCFLLLFHVRAVLLLLSEVCYHWPPSTRV